MKRNIDSVDQEAEREGQAMSFMKKNAPKHEKPYYGRNDFRKVSKQYRQDIADAEILWRIVKRDMKRLPKEIYTL